MRPATPPALSSFSHLWIRRQAGFTLTELLAVMAIIAALTAVAVPALTRDSEEQRFTDFLNRLVAVLQQAKSEAISSPNDWSVQLAGTYFQEGPVTGGTAAWRSRRDVPQDVYIGGVQTISAVPWNLTYVTPSYSAPMSGTVELRFLGTQQVLVGGQPRAASIFLASARRHVRVVVFPTTAQIQVYEGW